MASGLKQLCNVALAATTLTPLYTATADTAVSTIVVCNRSATATSFRLAHAQGGAADTLSQYFAYDVPILGNTMVPFTLGICLGVGDVLRGYAAAATLSVTAWGEEQGSVGDYEEGTFTVTGTGFGGTAPSGTARYVRVGKQVTVVLPALSGTSNATTFHLTGWPVGLLASEAVNAALFVRVADNGAAPVVGLLVFVLGGAVQLFMSPGAPPWTASGLKSLSLSVMTYLLP